jgi:hypothetical protein
METNRIPMQVLKDKEFLLACNTNYTGRVINRPRTLVPPEDKSPLGYSVV